MKRFIPDMSDEELDRLFREAAENYSPQPGKAAWEDIEERLDGKEAAPGRRKPLAWWWQRTFIIMILVGITYLFYAPPLPRKTDMKGGNANQKRAIPAAGAMKIAAPPAPVPMAGINKSADQ